MTLTQRTALKMIADPELAELTDWKAVHESRRLNPGEDVDGKSFCSAMMSLWIAARLARLIQQGNDDALDAFMDQVDPRRLVRDDID